MGRLFVVCGLLCLVVTGARAAELGPPEMTNRWMFVWRPMYDVAEVDRVIARLPEAAAAGYTGVALSHNIAPERTDALRAAADAAGLDIIAIVMGNPANRNDFEGVLSEGATFVVRDGALVHQPHIVDIANADFEAAEGQRFAGWTMQDDPGVTTYVDREVFHGGGSALRFTDVNQNEHRHARVAQVIDLIPHRQYRLSYWLKTDSLSPVDTEAKVLSLDTGTSLLFQTFPAQPTMDWQRVDLVFNSFEHEEARLYIGSWWGGTGSFWIDDVSLEEIPLVNVLRRAGCPVRVTTADGTRLDEGTDVAPIVDPGLHPWRSWHEPPRITVPAGSRLAEGDTVHISYYHTISVYDGRVNGCLTEPRVFEGWRKEVVDARDRLAPAAFLMSHDEIRVANRCAGCQARGMTPGQLLAENIRLSAQIIRDEAPGAQIWVWNDMFDPMHNAVDKYYAVNGSWAGSWEGLDPDVGIMNWHGGLMGANAQFFADLGLRQMLSGYYDGDEDGAAITAWKAATAEVPGIVGAMYTTWEDKYGALVPWAEAAWGGAAAGDN